MEWGGTAGLGEFREPVAALTGVSAELWKFRRSFWRAGCISQGHSGIGEQKEERRLEVRFRCQCLGARCGGRPHKGTRVRKQERLWLGVGAALERGAIVVGAGWVVASGLLLGLLGFRAQRRFAWGVVRDLAREHDVAQAGLHGIEFGGGEDVFLPRRKGAGDFLL